MTVFRRALISIAAVFAALWVGRVALQSVPIDYHRGSWAIPLVHSRAQAIAFVKTSLIPYGGMPADAQLADSGAEQMVMQPDATFPSGASAQDQYFFRWQASDTVAGPDFIAAFVDDEPVTRCLNRTCSHYRVRYTLHMAMLLRRWRPAFVRSFANWWIITHAQMAPRPKAVLANCGRGRLDEAALRRVIGSITRDDPYLHGADRTPRVRGIAALARFTPYELQVPDDPAISVAAAYVSDEQQGSLRGIEVYQKFVHPLPPPPGAPKRFRLRKNRYHWSHFDTADNEPICSGEHPHVSDLWSSSHAKPFRADVIADARYRLWDHINNAEKFRVKMSQKPRTIAATASGGRSVTIDWQTDRGTWHAVFTYDLNGRLTEADITRP